MEILNDEPEQTGPDLKQLKSKVVELEQTKAVLAEWKEMQSFLAEATALLSASLDYEVTLHNLARLVVPRLADWCTIDVAVDLTAPNDQTALYQIVIAHSDPTKEKLVDALRDRILPDVVSTTPVRQVFLSGQPQLIPVIPPELIKISASDEESRRILRELGLISALLVPLVARGRTLGVLTLNTAESGRILGPNDLTLAQELAHRAALSVDNARLYEAEQKARQAAEQAVARTARLQAVMMAFSEALTPSQVMEVVVTHGTAALGAMQGIVAIVTTTADGKPELEVTRSLGVENNILEVWNSFPLTTHVPLAAAVNEGKPVFVESFEDLVKRFPYSEERSQDLENIQALAAIPMQVQGRIIGALGFTFTQSHHFSQEEQAFMLTLATGCAQALERARLYEVEQQSHREAETARQRLTFLAETRNLLATSLEYEVTLQSVAQMVVPRMADWCTVHILDKQGWPQQVALAHVDPAKIEWARELQREMEQAYPYDPDAPMGLPNVLRTGKSELYADIPDELLMAVARDETELRIVREIGYSSVMVVPLVARGRVLGAIQFVATESGHHYDAQDLALAEELARYAATAVDNASLYQQVQQAVQLRDEFLSVAAHELKTPITSLKGHSQLITRQIAKTGTAEPERLRRTLEVINQQSDKLAYLVTQLLDVSRLESGRMVLNKQLTNVSELIESIVASMRIATAAEKHKLTLKSAQRPVLAQVDALRLEQVTTNLINNAIKYSPQDSLIQIEVEPVDTQAMLQITVSDRGIGVPLEHRPHLFERFYQAQPGNYVAGMGLGLYISRQIVELHHGQIEAEFPEEGGSRFIVRLPTGLEAAQVNIG